MWIPIINVPPELQKHFSFLSDKELYSIHKVYAINIRHRKLLRYLITGPEAIFIYEIVDTIFTIQVDAILKRVVSYKELKGLIVCHRQLAILAIPPTFDILIEFTTIDECAYITELIKHMYYYYFNIKYLYCYSYRHKNTGQNINNPNSPSDALNISINDLSTNTESQYKMIPYEWVNLKPSKIKCHLTDSYHMPKRFQTTGFNIDMSQPLNLRYKDIKQLLNERYNVNTENTNKVITKPCQNMSLTYNIPSLPVVIEPLYQYSYAKPKPSHTYVIRPDNNADSQNELEYKIKNTLPLPNPMDITKGSIINPHYPLNEVYLFNSEPIKGIPCLSTENDHIDSIDIVHTNILKPSNNLEYNDFDPMLLVNKIMGNTTLNKAELDENELENLHKIMICNHNLINGNTKIIDHGQKQVQDILDYNTTPTKAINNLDKCLNISNNNSLLVNSNKILNKTELDENELENLHKIMMHNYNLINGNTKIIDHGQKQVQDILDYNTTPTNTIPTNTMPTINTIPINTIPINTIPTNTMPTNTMPTNTIPTNTMPTNTMPTNTMPTNTMPTNTIPTNKMPTNTMPTNTIPTNTMPTNTIPINTIPTNTIPTNTMPTNTMPTNTMPTNTMPTNTIPTNKMPTNTMPTNTMPTNTMPTNTIPINTIPINTIPTNTMPTNTMPTNTMPTNTIPTNTIPTNTMPTNTMPTNAMPTNAMPTNTMPTNTMPTNTMPTNTMLTNTIPTNTMPTNTIPINTIPINTIPINTMPTNTMPTNTIPTNTVNNFNKKCINKSNDNGLLVNSNKSVNETEVSTMKKLAYLNKYNRNKYLSFELSSLV